LKRYAHYKYVTNLKHRDFFGQMTKYCFNECTFQSQLPGLQINMINQITIDTVLTVINMRLIVVLYYATKMVDWNIVESNSNFRTVFKLGFRLGLGLVLRLGLGFRFRITVIVRV